MHQAFLYAKFLACCFHFAHGQQYAGDVIQNSLPAVPGSEIAFFRINDSSNRNRNLTLINYYSQGSDNKRLVESNIQRAVVIVHGLHRDPGTYMSNMLAALEQTTPSNQDINFSSVAIMAPYFPNGDDKGIGYPWTDGLSAGRGSTSSALVWKASQWSAGGNSQYPYNATALSSYTILDQIVQYFDNATLFPKMKQIVVAGHSLGAQAIQRYAAIGAPLNTRSPVNYWIGNPNSYAWLSSTRPLPVGSCSSYDDYREGYSKFADYPMSYGADLVALGRAAILSNFNRKAINYARGIQDLGDDSSGCAPFTTGGDRNERFFNFIKAFPPSCPDPAGRDCDTIDFINTGHDAGVMFVSAAGRARLFSDNFYGTGTRSYDFGYPRQQTGDDPYPDPALNDTVVLASNETFAANMTYWGCWSDQDPKTLAYLAYNNNSNTVQLCTEACVAGKYTLAGLEAATQCWCGQALGYMASQVVDSSCQLSCAGNSSEKCGGNGRLSLYSTNQPEVRSPPGTPETVGNFNYVSCFKEANSGRALNGPAKAGTFMTLEYCASFCSGYRYFGTEYSSECYCGNDFSPGARPTSNVDCNYECANNTAEVCGGSNRLTIYQNPDWTASTSTSTTRTRSELDTTSNVPEQSAGISCPASNGTVVASRGRHFTIECGIDHQGGDLTSLTVSTFQQCIDACAQNTGCVGASLSGVGCYLKFSIGAALFNAGVWGAVILHAITVSSSAVPAGSTTVSSSAWVLSSVAPSATSPGNAGPATTTGSATTTYEPSSTPPACPRSNGTSIVLHGKSFLIECGMDHIGGGLKVLNVDSFQQCIDACAVMSDCVDVSLSGVACYLKSSIGGIVFNDVWGAKMVSEVASLSTPVSNMISTLTASSNSTITDSNPSTHPGDLASSSSTTIGSATSGSVASNLSSTDIVPVSTSDISGPSTSHVLSMSPTSTPITSSTGPSSSSTSPSSTEQTSTSRPNTLPSTWMTTSITATTSSASTALHPGFSSVGCFTDSTRARALPHSNGASSTQTSQKCALSCSARGYKYSGTEYSRECWCGNTLPATPAVASTCSMPCSGDRTQICGAGNRLSVVIDTTWPHPVYTPPEYRSSAPDVLWALSGCFAEPARARLLPTSVSLARYGGAGNATVGNCLDACAQKGTPYCGLEYYAECWGGRVLPTSLPSDGGGHGCDFPCKGNRSEACGGANQLLIYRRVPGS